MIEHVSNLYNGEYEWEAKLQSSNVVEIYIWHCKNLNFISIYNVI